MVVKPKAPKAKPTDDEFERVTKWRFQSLLALGLAPDQAVSLIEIPDVVHSVQNLIDMGCPQDIIVSLLQGD